ncbi:hypothetical protein BDY24DRAFT_148638 [Mrakia frigida]|uniref:uncharacterized protein n=1 Tax=Mrakia frigida TaxID=29902 RepID=UPI003FCC070A
MTSRRNVETEEAEEQNAELEDEAEEIADFLHQSSQQFALSSSQAGSVPPSSQRASSSFVRESSMAAPSTPSSSRTRVSNINIIEIPASSSSSSSTTQPTSTSHSIFSREDPEDIPSIASLTSLASSLNTTRDESSAPPQTLLRPSAQDSVTRYFDPLDFDDNFGVLSPEQLVVIRPYKGDDDDQVLEELRPKYIVMYDADPGFIRRVEVYRSSNPGLGVRVYFMMYVDSVEEQRYLSGLRKVMESFKRLIREKGTMLIPISGDPRGRPAEPNSTQSTLAKVISKRIAGGAAALAAESEPSIVRISPCRSLASPERLTRSWSFLRSPQVIVDMREFRSTLPSLLHASNVRIIPATLQVGDYILNPEMCVERKSIPDLIQSFNSGRLCTQCEMMSVHYKQPILLIEFEQNKSFSLQSIIELKAPGSHQARSDPTSGSSNSRDRAVADSDIQSRLVLLTLTFPRLRIIWSSSPFATADIFKDLKVNHSEPSAEKAILIGSADGEEGEGGGGNTSAQGLLRSLPGVNGKNYRHKDSVDFQL